MTAVDLLMALCLLLGLAWAGYCIAQIALDAHQRGRARVMAGRSWEPKGGRR